MINNTKSVYYTIFHFMMYHLCTNVTDEIGHFVGESISIENFYENIERNLLKSRNIIQKSKVNKEIENAWKNL